MSLPNVNASIFLSDVGYGHIVRQSAVFFALQNATSVNANLYTKRNIDAARNFFPKNKNLSFNPLFNNIRWARLPNGSPDINQINKDFEHYIDNSKQYIQENHQLIEGSDFVISDFVYEAFAMGAMKDIPTFGVCHFPWDWFFSKLYPPAIKAKTIKYMLDLSSKATKVFFPPFTPSEVLEHYKNAVEVPFIVRPSHEKVEIDNDRFKILIIDSGSGLLSHVIRKFLKTIDGKDLPYNIFITDNFEVDHPNVYVIPRNKLLVNYIESMDLVIGRAGFNTISECIALRTPMILFGESRNPEMLENIMHVNKERLGSFMTIKNFEDNFIETVDDFLQHEYHRLKKKMDNHSYTSNGAKVIVDEILKVL